MKYVNQHRSVQEFDVGDLVLISSKNIRPHIGNDAGKKLKPRYLVYFE